MSALRSLFFLALAGAALPAAATDYQLNGGIVRFSAPTEWAVAMQMSEGNPQVVAFAVKDPAAEGTDEGPRVSVTSRKLDDASAFQTLVNGALDKARQQTGFEQDKDNTDSGSLRYYASEGKARYHYREHFFFKSGVGVQVRCARPVLDKTSKQWTADFEKGCDQIAASLAK